MLVSVSWFVHSVVVWLVMGNHHILGQAIAVKKALEREQKELIAAGGTVRGRGMAQWQWVTSVFDLTAAERKFGLTTHFSQKVKWISLCEILSPKVWSKYILRSKFSGTLV